MAELGRNTFFVRLVFKHQPPHGEVEERKYMVSTLATYKDASHFRLKLWEEVDTYLDRFSGIEDLTVYKCMKFISASRHWTFEETPNNIELDVDLSFNVLERRI